MARWHAHAGIAMVGLSASKGLSGEIARYLTLEVRAAPCCRRNLSLGAGLTVSEEASRKSVGK